LVLRPVLIERPLSAETRHVLLERAMRRPVRSSRIVGIAEAIHAAGRDDDQHQPPAPKETVWHCKPEK
jgi:hypothetical protein